MAHPVIRMRVDLDGRGPQSHDGEHPLVVRQDRGVPANRSLDLDGWVVPPDTAHQRKRGRGSGRRTETMTQQLTNLVEQFCNFQRKQRGKTEGGVKTYRWILEQFLIFIRNRHGRLARVTDLTTPMIQAWMDDMAGVDLALSTIRVRQSVLSSFCGWLVKRDLLVANPVAKLERPPHHREPPKQVPGSEIMDALVEAAKARRRPRGRGDLPDHALHGHAARICCYATCPAPRWDVGSPGRPRQGRQDARHPSALRGREVPASVR